MCVEVILRHVRAKYFNVENIGLWVSVGVFRALIIQYAKLILRIILASVAYLTVPYYFSSPYLINGTSLWKTLLRVKFMYSFPLLRSSEMILILKRTRWNIFINMHSSKQIFQLFLYDFNEIEFLEKIFGISCNIKFNENSPCGSRVVLCGRRVLAKLLVPYHISEHD
jgi:hypothetical protein